MYMYQGFSLQFQVWNMGLREACDGKMRSQAPPRTVPGVHTCVHTEPGVCCPGFPMTFGIATWTVVQRVIEFMTFTAGL